MRSSVPRAFFIATDSSLSATCLFRQAPHRGLGIVVAGDDKRVYRGFGHTGSPLLFGHGGAGGQIGWADPASGLSLGFCTNGFDRQAVRQARRGVALSSRAADLCVDASA